MRIYSQTLGQRDSISKGKLGGFLFVSLLFHYCNCLGFLVCLFVLVLHAAVDMKDKVVFSLCLTGCVQTLIY